MQKIQDAFLKDPYQVLIYHIKSVKGCCFFFSSLFLVFLPTPLPTPCSRHCVSIGYSSHLFLFPHILLWAGGVMKEGELLLLLQGRFWNL